MDIITIYRKQKDVYFKKWCIYFMILCFSAAYVYFLSYSTSIFYPFYYGGDSAQFQTIGKAWTVGKIPYADLFDHKGPYIFWVNMLGYRITGNSGGIVLLQILNMFAFLTAVFKLSQLATGKNYVYGIAAVVVTAAVLMLSYSHGNMTEEYCLPFICFSAYFQVKYLLCLPRDKSCSEHGVKYALFYGISFAVCLLTRVTNGVTICAGVLLISLVLVKNRQFSNLAKNAAGFCAGTAAMCVPFVIFFWKNNALYEFVYGMLGYNLEYQKGMEAWITHATFLSWVGFLVAYVPYYSILITILLLYYRRNYLLAIYCMICMILESYLFFSGALYWQYVMIAVPQFVLLLNELMLIRNKVCRKLVWLAASCSVFVITVISISKVIHMRSLYSEGNDAGYFELISLVPEEDRDSFVAYGNEQLKQIYLLNDLLPCSRFFSVQEWHAGFSEELRQEIHGEFASAKAEWILTEGRVENIQDILDDDYEIISTKDDCSLYHLKKP